MLDAVVTAAARQFLNLLEFDHDFDLATLRTYRAYLAGLIEAVGST